MLLTFCQEHKYLLKDKEELGVMPESLLQSFQFIEDLHF